MIQTSLYKVWSNLVIHSHQIFCNNKNNEKIKLITRIYKQFKVLFISRLLYFLFGSQTWFLVLGKQGFTNFKNIQSNKPSMNYIQESEGKGHKQKL